MKKETIFGGGQHALFVFGFRKNEKNETSLQIVIRNFRFRYRLQFEFRYRFISIFRFRPKFWFEIQPRAKHFYQYFIQRYFIINKKLSSSKRYYFLMVTASY